MAKNKNQANGAEETASVGNTFECKGKTYELHILSNISFEGVEYSAQEILNDAELQAKLVEIKFGHIREIVA